MRFGLHGVTLCTAITFIQDMAGASVNSGFFAHDIDQTHLINLWFYLIILSVVGMSTAALLKQRDDKESDEQKTYIGFTREGANRLNTMVLDLLGFSQSRSHHSDRRHSQGDGLL